MTDQPRLEMTSEELAIELLTTGQSLEGGRPEAERLLGEIKNKYAHALAEKQREEIDLSAHPGDSVYPCEDCAVIRAANSIDPEVQP